MKLTSKQYHYIKLHRYSLEMLEKLRLPYSLLRKNALMILTIQKSLQTCIPQLELSGFKERKMTIKCTSFQNHVVFFFFILG